jgi:PII-like signaling protein
MKITGKAGILKIYVGESDKIHGRPLFEEIVFEARKAGMAGATVYKGIMSFGASHSVHTMKIFALSGDMPVSVEIVDTVEKLDDFAAKVNELMDAGKKGGLVTFQEVDVLRYEVGEKYRVGQK